MKKRIILLLIVLGLSINFGCGKDIKKPLVGKWEQKTIGTKIEFLENGDFIEIPHPTTKEPNPKSINGKYTIKGDTIRFTYTLNGKETELEEKFRIKNNELELFYSETKGETFKSVQQFSK